MTMSYDPMQKPGLIEREFGVAIPGIIRPPSEWTRTALKRLPSDSPLDIQALFGRSAPLIVDLGCGNGRFLIGSALARPEYDHIGIDILPMVLRYATRRGNQRGLRNLRFAAIDAERFVAQHLPRGGVAEIHCYHPQPYHDIRDAHKRLLTPAFLASVCGALAPQGRFVVQTDNAAYWNYLIGVLPSFFDFEKQNAPWPDALQGRTRREILARSRGYPIFAGQGTVKPLLAEQRVQIVASLQLPVFDAGRRNKDLDQLEKGD